MPKFWAEGWSKGHSWRSPARQGGTRCAQLMSPAGQGPSPMGSGTAKLPRAWMDSCFRDGAVLSSPRAPTPQLNFSAQHGVCPFPGHCNPATENEQFSWKEGREQISRSNNQSSPTEPILVNLQGISQI